MARQAKDALGVAAGLGLPRPVAARRPEITTPPHAPSFEDSVALPLQRPASSTVCVIVIAHAGRTRLLALEPHLDWQPGDLLSTERVSIDLNGDVPGLIVHKPQRKLKRGTLLDDAYRLLIQADDRNYLGLTRGSEHLLAAVRTDVPTECLLVPATAIGKMLDDRWPN